MTIDALRKLPRSEKLRLVETLRTHAKTKAGFQALF